MSNKIHNQRGAMMIEILITLAITVLGLYGLMEVQKQFQRSEVESYQRTQALLLLEDMSSRIETNRGDAADYLTTAGSPAFTGAGADCGAASADVADNDLFEWCSMLQGVTERLSGASVGAMTGGRGCIEEIGAGAGQYMITVAWQGLGPTVAPPASVSCGLGQYNDADKGCADELCRRAVTTMVRIAPLI